MNKIIFLIILIVLIGGCSKISEKNLKNSPLTEEETIITEPIKNTSGDIKEELIKEPFEQVPIWKNIGTAISGNYADAEIIELENGVYRMYYSLEPEVQGFKGQVYSAISSDGIKWDKEDGERMEWAIFPSVIKLPDGRYRMYFQNQGLIKSAISSDGLSWNEEYGIRIDTANNAGLNLENVAAPTVIKLGDEYILVYRGTINEKYPDKVPNNNIQLFLWAISKDGLTFEKKGIALESRNDEFKGLLDGPEFVQWDDEVRLYFWSYKGVYHITFKDNKFLDKSEFDFTAASNPNVIFSENPPSDPTLIKVNNKWFLYYGQHTKGIYYATLEN